MKRIIKLSSVFILALVTVVSVVVTEQNSRSPVERSLNAAGANADRISSGSDGIEGTDTLSAEILNNTHTARYEFLSCDIFDDANIALQTEYKEDFYEGGCLPDPDYLTEYTDYQSMMNDYPEVGEFISSNGNSGMTEAEYFEFLDKHLDEYTVIRHPESEYIFLRCRITNLKDTENTEYIGNLRVFAMCGDELEAVAEAGLYFDKPQNTEDGKRLMEPVVYTFKPGETIECVVGFLLTDYQQGLEGDITYFTGFEPAGLENYSQLNPAADKSFVALSDLPKGLET